MTQRTDAIREARQAFSAHDWARTYDLLTSVPQDTLEASDLEAMAESAWWMAKLDDCITARERAYSLYVDAGDKRKAATVAIALAKDNFARSSGTIGMAWLNRAEHLLEGDEECIEFGALERTRSVIAYEGEGDYDKAIHHARSALDIATKHGDRDLMAIALEDQGRALVSQGEVEKGMAMMDEATVAAVSGDLSPMATGVVYCNLITVCEDIADYARAGEWTDAAKRWCERVAIAGFPGLCRVHRAGIIRLRGAWAEAEDEALRAARELEHFNHGYTAEAFYQLGEIRFELGDLALAEESFSRAHDLGRDPQPGLALLQLAQGKVDAAASAIARSLREESRDLRRARLIPAYVEIMLAAGRDEGIDDLCAELEGLAATYATAALTAAAREVRGRVALHRDEAETAIGALRDAVRHWKAVEAPYLVAKTRVLLARAYAAEGDHEAARLEFAAARSCFESLGAKRDTAEVDELEGDAAPAPAIPAPSDGGSGTFRREGEYWLVSYGDDSFRLKDTKGLQFLAELLRAPNKEFHALELVGGSLATTPAPSVEAGDVAVSSGDLGAVLDPAAKAAYKARYEELQATRDEAEGWGDDERAARAREEMDYLADELSRAVGLGGRDRKMGSDAERARVNVTRTVRAALERIQKHSPALGEHLAKSLHTGTFCSYRPDERARISWDL